MSGRRAGMLAGYVAGSMLLSIPVHVMYAGAWWAVSTVAGIVGALVITAWDTAQQARRDRRNAIAAQQYARAIGYGTHR
jgi:hypothetical protein